MSLRLNNTASPAGGGRYNWEAFVEDEGSGELDDVQHVEYVLHPTFPEPVRRIENPEGGFVLRTNGWGVFHLTAFVLLKNGKRVKLERDLQF